MLRKSTDRPKPNWEDLLRQALTEPGVIADCYSRFHRFSFLNQIEAFVQCAGRGIEPGPLASYKAWQDKGRQVRKGEKALWLWMPIDRRAKETDTEGNETERHWTEFRYLPRWFVLSQTEGDAIEPEPLPDWDLSQALDALEIEPAPYREINGNVQGYAIGRRIAVNPLAAHPHRTRFHELAHVVLGHTDRDQLRTDGRELTRDVAELEAEAVALICCESLGLPGAAESRGYIQGWYKGSTVPADSAKRIFQAADRILKAGQAARPDQQAETVALPMAA